MKIKLNSFRPICSTALGRKAISDYSLLPFIVGSCRREPDFESQFPSITSLYRGGKFAPKLLPGDLVIYITTKGKWFTNEKHYRLVGIVEVINKMADHDSASAWYREQDLPLPSNCMVIGNPPQLFSRTSGTFRSKKYYLNFLQQYLENKIVNEKEMIGSWDQDYQRRAEVWPDFNITETLFLELHNPPILSPSDMEFIFGRQIPKTQIMLV